MARRLQTLPGLVLAVVGVKHVEGLARHLAQAWERVQLDPLGRLDRLDHLDNLSVEVSGNFLMSHMEIKSRDINRCFKLKACSGHGSLEVFSSGVN